jgi:hypothetical protein
VRADHDHVPLAGERLVRVQRRAADALDGSVVEARAERADERRAAREPGVAAGGRRGEVAGRLEAAERDDGVGVGERAVLDRDRVGEQRALRRHAERRPGGLRDLGGRPRADRRDGRDEPASGDPADDRHGGQGRGAPVEPALTEGRPPGQRAALVLLRLDPLGEDGGARLVGVGADRAHDRGGLGAERLLDEAHVELDDVGAQERHEGDRAPVGTDVVECEAPAAAAQGRDRAQQLGRAVGEAPLGDLGDDGQLARGALQRGRGDVRHGVEDIRLDVHEQRGRGVERAEGAIDGGRAAGAVEVGGGTLGRRGAEQRAGRLERRADRAAGQGLVGDDAPVGQGHDGLVDGAHAAGSEDVGERRGGGGRRGECGHSVEGIVRAHVPLSDLASRPTSVLRNDEGPLLSGPSSHTHGQEDPPAIGPDPAVLSDSRRASYIRPTAPDRA